MVEQRPFKALVDGSSPSQPTILRMVGLTPTVLVRALRGCSSDTLLFRVEISPFNQNGGFSIRALKRVFVRGEDLLGFVQPNNIDIAAH